MTNIHTAHTIPRGTQKLPHRLVRILASLLLILFGAGSGLGQSHHFGTWNILNIKYTINAKWSLFGEGQVRSLGFYQEYYYHEFKGGVLYKINPNTNIGLAIGDYDTYQEGGIFLLPKTNNEFRIWPQLIVIQPFHKLKIEHRYRSEFRYTSNGYRNRFRYRLALYYPFGKERNGYRHFQISVGDELFFSNKGTYFERNRLSCSVNYKISKNTSFLVGYMYQFDYKLSSQLARDFLQLGVFTEFYKKKNA
jgi:hypothetical protein